MCRKGNKHNVRVPSEGGSPSRAGGGLPPGETHHVRLKNRFKTLPRIAVQKMHLEKSTPKRKKLQYFTKSKRGLFEARAHVLKAFCFGPKC